MTCESSLNGVDHVSHEKYLVTGVEQPTIRATLAGNCLTARQYVRHPSLGIEMCGPEGKWFELKGE